MTRTASQTLRIARYLWALPCTVLGLLFVPGHVLGGSLRVAHGVIEVANPLSRIVLRLLVPLKGGASAMTLGHVIVGRDTASLERARGHEKVHVRQYERWGVFLLPAYLLSSVWALLRGKHFYYANRFEAEAFRVTGPHKDSGRPA